MGNFVSLMSGFKDIGKDGKSKGVIRVQADDLIFNADDRVVAQQAADAILATIVEHLSQGKAPDGQPLPGLKASTVERRAYEDKQGQRSGEAHPRYVDPEFRKLVSKNYKRDYKGKGEMFTPHEGLARGQVSGLLLESMAARGDRSGKGVTIYVAAKRGRPRPSSTSRPQETMSALESVLAGAPVASPRLMEAPKIRKSLTELMKSLLGNPKDLKRAFSRLVKQAKKSAEELHGLAEEVTE